MEGWCAFVSIIGHDYKTLWICHCESYADAETRACLKLIEFTKENKIDIQPMNFDDMDCLKAAIEQAHTDFEVSAEIVKIEDNKEDEFML